MLWLKAFIFIKSLCKYQLQSGSCFSVHHVVDFAFQRESKKFTHNKQNWKDAAHGTPTSDAFLFVSFCLWKLHGSFQWRLIIALIAKWMPEKALPLLHRVEFFENRFSPLGKENFETFWFSLLSFENGKYVYLGMCDHSTLRRHVIPDKIGKAAKCVLQFEDPLPSSSPNLTFIPPPIFLKCLSVSWLVIQISPN